MKKIFTFIAAMLVAFAANADPVVLPAVLDVNNVSFRSVGMPDFVIEEEQDYAGTYLDMGPNNYSTDTLLYAEWDVTIQPMKYNVAVDVYNTNSWRIQLDLLNQSDEVVKAIRYKGSSGDKGQFSIGSMDMSDLEAGNYKVRAHAATAWSLMKLKDIIFEADYHGVSVALPGTLLPAYAEFSANASVTNGAIAFAPSTAHSEYATWNVNCAVAGDYHITIDFTATNGHTYGVALLSADGQTQIGAVAEAQSWDTGIKEIGTISVPAAGNYMVKLTNATQWSEAVLNSITLTPVYTVAGVQALCGTDWANNAAENDMTYSDGAFKWSSGEVYYDGTSTWGFRVVKDHTWTGYPDGNYEIKSDWKLTDGAGYYNVEIAYTPNPEAIEVTATYLYPKKVEVMCGWNDWAPVLMEYEEGNLFASCKINLAPGYYSGEQGFKVRVNGNSTWYGNNWYMDRTNCSNWIFDDANNNCGLVADVAGEYTFTYVYASGEVSIAYPESFTREAATTNYQSLCVPFNASITNATVYDVAAMSNTAISLTEHIGNMEAGHAYIIKPLEAEVNMVITKEDGAPTVTPIDLSGDNGLYGFLTNTVDGAAYQYNYDANWAVYVLSENQFHLIAETASATIGSTKAYLHYAVPAGAPAVLHIVEGENGATAIQNLEGNETAVKFIENGKLFIRKNGAVYDTTGAVVR